MHTYRKANGESLWTVGYYILRPDLRYQPAMNSEWHSLSDHDKEIDAMERVNFLNGGNGTVCCIIEQP